MLLDKVDYERFKSMLVGRFITRTTNSPANAIIACVNIRNKHGDFNISASYVHSIICKDKGYLWHRNANMLDNRRENLETDIPLQVSTVGIATPELTYDPDIVQQYIDLLTNQPETE